MHGGRSGRSPERGKWRACGGDNINNEQEIREEVLKRVKPTEEEKERILATAGEIIDKIEEEIKKRKIEGDAILVGSVAKGTHLKNTDIDVFIRFSPEYSRKYMEKTGLEIAYRVMKNGVAKYAEHPYLRGNIKGYDVDIVPCYKIERVSEKLSSVDRTPFHTDYIKNHLKEEQRDEVRLLKSFLKGIGIYGSEARVQGFSGYLCELLIVKYENFENTLKNVAKWRKKVYLYLKERGKRFHDPLIFIDPVDSNRNVASVVSEYSKSLFIYASKEFLNKPSLKFFFPNPITPKKEEEIKNKIEERGTKIYIVEFPKPDLIDDILYPQIRRTMGIIEKILQEFKILNIFFIVNEKRKKIHFIVELERDILPKIRRHEGPPVWHENTKKFIERWKTQSIRGPYIDGYRFYVELERKERSVEEILRKEINNYKIGKHFEKMKDYMKTGKIDDMLHEIDKKELTKIFFFKFPWEW